MSTILLILDPVVLLENIEENSLFKGNVGTIVEKLDEMYFLVEFSNLDGVAYEITEIHSSKLTKLFYKRLLLKQRNQYILTGRCRKGGDLF